MRDVVVLKMLDSKLVHDKCGKFHGWGVYFDEYIENTPSYTAAIVEFEDGKVELVDANYIQFLGE